MTRFKYVIAAVVLATSSVTFAGYDKWDCEETDQLENTFLQCVSCGIQKYYQDNGKDVVPSPKWILLLGLTARQSGIVTNASDKDDKAKADLRQRVIQQIQRYGFCKKYGENRTSSQKSKDLPFWKDGLYDNVNRKYLSKDEFLKVAQSFGFSDSGYGNHSSENLMYLINNRPKRLKDYEDEKNVPADFSEQSYEERKKSFKERLAKVVNNDGKEYVSGSVEGDDLKVCLEQVNQLQNRSDEGGLSSFFSSNRENINFCNSMASACDMNGSSFCGTVVSSSGAEVKPVPSHGSSPGRPLPPPPPPGTGKPAQR